MGQTLEVFRAGGLERQEELKNDTRRAAGHHFLNMHKWLDFLWVVLFLSCWLHLRREHFVKTSVVRLPTTLFNYLVLVMDATMQCLWLRHIDLFSFEKPLVLTSTCAHILTVKAWTFAKKKTRNALDRALACHGPGLADWHSPTKKQEMPWIGL